jgi:2-keto-3-deoxy-L-rhamnonate aldolase RhmA
MANRFAAIQCTPAAAPGQSICSQISLTEKLRRRAGQVRPPVASSGAAHETHLQFPASVMKPLIMSRETVAHGTFVKTDSPQIIELLGLTALDFAVLDAEHAPFDRAAIDRMMMAARAAALPLLVRLPDTAAATIQNALDLGAAGIVVPHVDSATVARQVVGRAKFRGGERGFSISPRASGYGTLSRSDAIALGDAARVVCQIESRQGLEEVNAIAAVDGVDALFIGRADLALSLGVADARGKEMALAVDRIIAAAADAGRVCGMHVGDVAEADRFAAAGVSWFIIGSDQSLLLQAVGRVCRPRATTCDVVQR